MSAVVIMTLTGMKIVARIFFFVTKQYNFTDGKCNRDDSISFRNVNITIMR